MNEPGSLPVNVCADHIGTPIRNALVIVWNGSGKRNGSGTDGFHRVNAAV